MSNGVNKVIIIGNLGQDPELRQFPDGGAVCNVNIATSESWKDKQTGQPQERTEWHRVVFRNKLAEIVKQYLHKGSKVYVEGSLRTRKWQDKQSGQDRYTTEVEARNMQMLDSREPVQGGAHRDDYQGGDMGGIPGTQPQGGHQGGPQAGHDQPMQHGYDHGGGGGQTPGQRSRPQQPAQGAPAHDFGDFNDDIPF